MISNAVLSRIDAPGTPTPQGAITYTTGATIAVRVNLQAMKSGLAFALGARVKDCEAVCFIPMNTTVAEGQRIVVTLDGDSSRTFDIMWIRSWVKAGGLPHRECFLKVVQ